jgi:hypothetical protein
VGLVSVLRCDGCHWDYPETTFTVTGSERPWLAIVIPYEEVAFEIAAGWTITMHVHQEAE